MEKEIGAKVKRKSKKLVRKKKSLNVIRSINIRFNKVTSEYENKTEFRINFLKNRGGYDQEELIYLFKSNSSGIFWR